MDGDNDLSQIYTSLFSAMISISHRNSDKKKEMYEPRYEATSWLDDAKKARKKSKRSWFECPNCKSRSLARILQVV